ncbi:50S ribosomal protein L6 [Candidatus Kaiserbacteria bacterium RIFCSPLOWO2_01_FULL_54_13]|uniref:Large ribosomal subunit protein uL6 n=1 Tax=Candidatus Kaiserbacteria bacterium RIFCSPLOWO2_01_FULL_54_13 TaxID=1798512 RepID=A0A1F6F325_9BACT|nr:MAG: 50S ribosomal protein L6 [Candidatus Kaiserbacteria bacterium RIFCSPLOWO2_01_FULL_54_13]
MSRLSKKPIPIPSGVEVDVKDGELIVKGKGGTLTRTLHPAVSVAVSGQEVQVTPSGSSRLSRALPGTFAAHIRNMISGVSHPFSKRLAIEGIGFRAEIAGKSLKLMLGFSHPVVVAIPESLKVAVDKNVITVAGPDKEAVGQFAASVRALKKPEPYKGKGIRYEDEIVRRKQGKKAVATAAA